MGVKSAGMGGDGTKIPSPCTPLRQTGVICPVGVDARPCAVYGK